MLYLSLQKELPRRRQTTQRTEKALVPKVITISLLNPPRSYRLACKKGTCKVIKLFV